MCSLLNTRWYKPTRGGKQQTLMKYLPWTMKSENRERTARWSSSNSSSNMTGNKSVRSKGRTSKEKQSGDKEENENQEEKMVKVMEGVGFVPFTLE